MKQIILSATVATAILFGTTGCSDKKTEGETVQQAKEVLPAVSLKERKSAFDSKIKILSEHGFDLNRTKADSYLLTVKDEKQAVASLLGILNMGTIDAEQKALLEEAFKQGKIGIEVNWDKYAANEKESVFVYYLGNGDEAPYIQKLFMQKKIGAYLSYNGKDQLKHIKVKDIDETIKTDENETTHITLKGMYAQIAKSPTKTDPKSDYDLFGGTFSYVLTDTENNNTFTIGYKNPECSVKKTNEYLGTQQCRFPTFDIDFKTTSQNDAGTIHLSINDTVSTYKTTAHNKKIKAMMDFKIASIDAKGEGLGKKGIMHIKDIKIVGNADNIDEEVIKSYMTLLSHPPKDYNETIIQLMSSAGKLYSSGMTFDYQTSIASIEGESDEGKFMLDTYEGHGKGSFEHNINYKDVSSVKHISITDTKSQKPLLDLKNFKFGYEINDLYNFLPAFLEFSGALAVQNQSGKEEISDEMEKKLTEMGMHLVHNGVGFSLKPIGWDALQTEANGKTIQLGKVDLLIDSQLKKNDVPLDANNPMSAMMLLSYFNADGKLVLSKKDLEQLSATMPPEMIGMLMMFAKYEGENAVFILKFENGHLMINGQPVM